MEDSERERSGYLWGGWQLSAVAIVTRTGGPAAKERND